MGSIEGRGRRVVQLLALLILFLFLTGCDSISPGLETVSSSPKEATEEQSESADQDHATQEGKSPTISLMPETPMAAAEVRALIHHVPAPYELIWERNSQVIEGARDETLSKGQIARGDTLIVRLRYEGGEIQASARVGNSLPEVVAINFADPAIHHGVDIVLEPVAIDADGDPVYFSYRWIINGEEVPDQNGSRLPGHLFHKGDRIAVHVTPSDRFGEGATFVGREFVIPGAPPQFVSNPPTRFRNALYQYEATAIDPDGDPVRYSLTKGPKGMSMDADSGLLTWDASDASSGEYLIRLRARDKDGMEAFQEFSLIRAEPDGTE